ERKPDVAHVRAGKRVAELPGERANTDLATGIARRRGGSSGSALVVAQLLLCALQRFEQRVNHDIGYNGYVDIDRGERLVVFAPALVEITVHRDVDDPRADLLLAPRGREHAGQIDAIETQDDVRFAQPGRHGFRQILRRLAQEKRMLRRKRRARAEVADHARAE